MKLFNHFVLLLSIAVLFSQCNSNTASSVNGTLISGKIKGSENLSVILDKVELSNKIAMLGSVKADGSGAFNFDITSPNEPGLYRLRIGAKQYYFVTAGDEQNVAFEGSLNDFSNFNVKITGSEDAQSLNEAMRKIQSRTFSEADIKNFIATSKNPVSSMWIVTQGITPSLDNIDIFKSVVSPLASKLPKSTYTKDYTNYVAQLENQINKSMAAQRIQVGNPAPDLEFTGPAGQTYKLSDLKGKTVLLDFWASWCRPCRRENPSVVKVYEKYKNKGFTVFSVSLDSKKDRWLQAIKKDKLTWEYHVSDLKGWSSVPAGMYGVRSIPATFMIDKDGKIAATGLRGAESIESTLKKIL